jgi:3-ketosteroid 9alpha-monooxygenase subunit A
MDDVVSTPQPRAQQSGIREIDSGTPLSRYARGWHCLGLADRFHDGKPHAVSAFGTKLVVFEIDGRLQVLDAYCRHMGGDLSRGEIKGDSIACPFHDWRWNGAGKCTEIPYAKRVPRRARTRSWICEERNKQLFVWHDPEGIAPTDDVAIPVIEEALSDEWSDWRWSEILIENSTPREVIDNVVDMAHFFYVHFAFPTRFRNVFDGHLATQYLTSKGRADVTSAGNYSGDNTTLDSVATYHGPSYMINTLHSDIGGFAIEAILVNCHYPVSPDSFHLQVGVIVKKIPGLEPAHQDKIAAKIADSFSTGFFQDVEVWKTKTKMDNPLLCEEDGPVYQLRRWYEQFYVDRADVTDEMVNRFEFEVDVSTALENWEREVAANVAAAAAAST